MNIPETRTCHGPSGEMPRGCLGRVVSSIGASSRFPQLACAVLAVAALAGLSFAAPTEIAQDPAAPVEHGEGEAELQLTLSATLAREEDGLVAIARGELGRVQGGKRYRVAIAIDNPFDEDLPFADIWAACSCSSMTFSGSAFPRRSTLRGELIFYPPRRAAQGKVSLDLTAVGSHPERQTVARFRFEGELEGALDVGPNVRQFEVGENDADHVIPLYITPPIKPDELEVSLSKELRDVTVSLHPVHDRLVEIRLQVPRSQISTAGISGELAVGHKASGQRRSIMLTFVPFRYVRISPTFLSFHRDPGSQDVQVASIVVQLRERIEFPEDHRDVQPPKSTTPEVTCRAAFPDGTPVDLTVLPMSGRIWRLRLELPFSGRNMKAVQRESRRAIDLKLAIEGQLIEMSIPCRLED